MSKKKILTSQTKEQFCVRKILAASQTMYEYIGKAACFWTLEDLRLLSDVFFFPGHFMASTSTANWRKSIFVAGKHINMYKITEKKYGFQTGQTVR